ncbi:MAG: diacylglycerol kinase family protein [Gemmatimonadaceae bacterium]
MAVLALRRVLMIVNPSSKRGRLAARVAQRAFAEAAVQVQVRESSSAEAAGRMAQSEGPAFDAVFSLGGDGTVAGMATALAHTGVPLGIIPAGTGNLVARALGIPTATAAAVHSLPQPVTRAIDVTRLGDGRCSVFAAGTGIDAEMITRATPH